MYLSFYVHMLKWSMWLFILLYSIILLFVLSYNHDNSNFKFARVIKIWIACLQDFVQACGYDPVDFETIPNITYSGKGCGRYFLNTDSCVCLSHLI